MQESQCYKYHHLSLSLSSWWFYGSCRSRNAYKYPSSLSLSLSLSLSWWFYGSCGGATLVKITYFGWLVKPGGTAIRFYTLNPVPVNIHCRDLFVSYRDLYLLAVGLWECTQIVIVVLICYLPQLQHHAFGASEVRSLALLGPSSLRPVDPVRRELYRRLAAASSGTSSTSGWVAPAATLPVSPPPLARGTEDGTSARVPRPKGKRRLSARHPAAPGN